MIEKDERKRIKLDQDRIEKETKKWEREIRKKEKRQYKFENREPSFEVIKVSSNSNARFTTYFDTYKDKINRYSVDPAQ